MQPGTVTEVREPGWVWTLVWTAFPALGAAAGWLVVRLSDWAADQRWVPLRGLFRLVDRHASPAVTVATIAAGAVVGLVLAYLGHLEKVAVTVTDDAVEVRRADRGRRVERASVGAAFVDGKHLVVQDAAGAELVREKTDLPAAGLAAAFTAHGYPWREADPHAGDFRLWVEGLPDLPPGADPLLRARAKVLGKRDEADELRGELARIGVVVRDERKRQYVRVRP